MRLLTGVFFFYNQGIQVTCLYKYGTWYPMFIFPKRSPCFTISFFFFSNFLQVEITLFCNRILYRPPESDFTSRFCWKLLMKRDMSVPCDNVVVLRFVFILFQSWLLNYFIRWIHSPELSYSLLAKIHTHLTFTCSKSTREFTRKSNLSMLASLYLKVLRQFKFNVLNVKGVLFDSKFTFFLYFMKFQFSWTSLA